MRQFVELLRTPSWRVVVAGVIVVALLPAPATAENFFEALFGISSRPGGTPSPVASFFADPFGVSKRNEPAPRASSGGGYGPAYCVRMCDGKYFPLHARGGMTPAQLCNAFCPASPTRVFTGRSIGNAVSSNGERYSQIEHAYAYRTALNAACTCNGRDPAGLAPIDLSIDTTLRPGDVVSTSSGLIAYTGVSRDRKVTEFTPIEDYAGLGGADLRARLRDLKVAPVSADVMSDDMPLADHRPEATPMTDAAPRLPDRRAGLH